MTYEQPDSEMVDRMAEALARGRTLEAIKIYCESTGQGLRESKDFVDALIPQLVEKDPERFKALTNRSKGCGAAAVAIAFIVGLLICLV